MDGVDVSYGLVVYDTCGGEGLVLIAESLRDPHNRDAAMEEINPQTADGYLVMWSVITESAKKEDRPATLSLMALAAWVLGEKDHAMSAVREALAINPDYTLAQKLGMAIVLGFPVSKWLNRNRRV
ncbi:DUF4192 family protein [Streptomyces diastaticus]